MAGILINEILLLFFKEKSSSEKSFIHFYIEELAESLIDFSIKERRSIKEKETLI